MTKNRPTLGGYMTHLEEKHGESEVTVQYKALLAKCEDLMQVNRLAGERLREVEGYRKNLVKQREYRTAQISILNKKNEKLKRAMISILEI